MPGAPLSEIDAVGVGFGLATAAAVAAFSLLGERASRSYGAVGSMARAFAVASLLWVAVQAPHGVPELLLTPEHLPAVAVIAVIGTAIPFALFSWGVARARAQAASLAVSLEPVAGAVLAWAWLGQMLSPAQAAGGALVLAAVLGLQRR